MADPTDILGALSILDDLTGILHGKGGLNKVALGLDIIEKIAGDIAQVTAFIPGAQPIAVAAGLAAKIAGAAEAGVDSATQS